MRSRFAKRLLSLEQRPEKNSTPIHGQCAEYSWNSKTIRYSTKPRTSTKKSFHSLIRNPMTKATQIKKFLFFSADFCFFRDNMYFSYSLSFFLKLISTLFVIHFVWTCECVCVFFSLSLYMCIRHIDTHAIKF